MSDPLAFSCPPSEPPTLIVHLSGQWTLYDSLPTIHDVERQLERMPSLQRVAFDAQHLAQWDSSLLAFLLKVQELCRTRELTVDLTGLPHGIQRLIALATAVPERSSPKRVQPRESWIAAIGTLVLSILDRAQHLLQFLGEVMFALGRFVRGQARFRRADLALLVQDCGAQALPIVTLISFLVGLILAFVGAVQLRQFGAQIYIANLVGLGMAREMGAMMTAVIMAGRTGSAFAAQLGSMHVNQEIDAFRTMGIAPMEFLVLPRILALTLMMPLLCLYADLVGILGGAFVGVTMLDLGGLQYFQQTRQALTLTDFFGGLFKSLVFGVVVALIGCLQGLRCGNSSAAVGMAATSAVVLSIVVIVICDALLTVLYDILGI
ncbi:MAG: MlaE family lipid ABC transporter permease subunit [Nitrospirae bacterium]|nr:MAG: MlaE family lipid ABC transporter permease subunit [Nitrospirota bacterium]